MTPRSLKVLAAAFLVLLCAWGLRRALGDRPAKPTPLWPRREVPDRIRIAGPSGTVVLARDAAGPWTIEEPFRFAADQRTVAGFLDKLSKAGLSEPLGSDPSRHALFALNESSAVRVQAFAGPGAAVLDILVGAAGASWDSAFVRSPGDDIVREARGLPREELERPAGGWADLEVCALDELRLLSLEVRRGAKTVRFEQDHGRWRPKESDRLRAALTALSRLQADGVEPDAAVNPLVLKGLGSPQLEVRAVFSAPGGPQTLELAAGHRSPEFDHPVRKKGLAGFVYRLKPYRLEPFFKLAEQLSF